MKAGSLLYGGECERTKRESTNVGVIGKAGMAGRAMPSEASASKTGGKRNGAFMVWSASAEVFLFLLLLLILEWWCCD